LTPLFNNSSIQTWHCNAFKAIYKGSDGTYDQNWIIGVYTPHFLYHIPNFTMFTDIDGQSRPNYSMYGQFPQSNGSTPSISITTEKSPRSSYINSSGSIGLAAYAQFGYGSLHIFYISMLNMPCLLVHLARAMSTGIVH